MNGSAQRQRHCAARAHREAPGAQGAARALDPRDLKALAPLQPALGEYAVFAKAVTTCSRSVPVMSVVQLSLRDASASRARAARSLRALMPASYKVRSVAPRRDQ